MNEITTKEEYFAFLSNIKKTNDKIKRAYELLDDSERNTDGRNYLLEPVDVRKVLCMISVFRIHEHKTYVSYQEIKYVDEELLKWPHIERLIQEENIAASCYKDSELLKRKRVNIFNYAFVKSMNQYLDSVEDVFIFIKNKLYPFLIEHKKEIRLEDLKVYCSTMYDGTKIRESKREDVVWLRAKNNTLLSFDNIRILDSAPIDCSVLDVLEIQNIEDYFSQDNIKRLMRSCKNSIEVQQLQKILEYYGYQLEESVKVSQKKAIDVSEIIKTAEEMNRELTSPFNKTKREYVQALESYRSYLYQYRNLLKLSYEDNFMVSFEDGYCSEELKNRLIELEIYREFDDHGLSHEFLKALAVPHEFASDTVIDYRIYSAVFAKAAGYRFPVSEGERYKNCQLIDEIIMSLYHTKRNINRILANYRKQIVVKNVNGQYMSINTDLFYSSEEYQLTDSEFECYHIDETKYDSRYLEAVGIDFLEVEEEFAMYDVEGEEEEFYRWIKSYQSDELTLEEKQIVEYLRNHPERVDEILKKI